MKQGEDVKADKPPRIIIMHDHYQASMKHFVSCAKNKLNYRAIYMYIKEIEKAEMYANCQ